MAVPNYIPEWCCPAPIAFPTGNTIVYIIPASTIPFDAPKIQILFGNHGLLWGLDEVWVGHPGAGDPYDFDGNQAQITFDGNPDFSTVNDDVLSDLVTFALDSSKNFIISAFIGSHAAVPRSSCFTTGHYGYNKLGNDAATTDKTGYTGPSWGTYLLMIARFDTTSIHQLSGTVKEKGSPVARTVRSYVRSTGSLFGETASLADGSFSVDAPDPDTEMFVVAFDDDAGLQYNALIFDRVKAA